LAAKCGEAEERQASSEINTAPERLPSHWFHSLSFIHCFSARDFYYPFVAMEYE